MSLAAWLRKYGIRVSVRISAEGEGLEPPRACARLISSQVPYQLGLALQVPVLGSVLSVGETGFEPATPASRTQCSTGLSYSPMLQARAKAKAKAVCSGTLPKTVTSTSRPDGWGGIRTHESLHPTRFPIVLLKPLGHPSLVRQARASPSPRVGNGQRTCALPTDGEGGIRTHASLSGPTV